MDELEVPKRLPPPRELAAAGGVHLATAYRWCKGDSRPSRLAREKLKAAKVEGPWDFAGLALWPKRRKSR